MIHRQTWMACLYCAMMVAALWASAAERGVSQGAQFLPSTDALEPGTTFEVRFDQPVAAADQVGLESPSPLMIKPALPGTFRWLSRRSGLYTPTARPALATSYQFSLRPGLRDAEGQPVKASLQHTLATPAFGVLDYAPDTINSNLTAKPLAALSFNDQLTASNVAAQVSYRNAKGIRVPARALSAARYALSENNLEIEGIDSPWVRPPALPALAPHSVDTPNASTCVLSNCLLVEPIKPLPAGDGWVLVVEKGLPNAAGKLRTQSRLEIPLGNVQPFVVEECEALNLLNRGREITLQFSKRLATNVTAEVLSNYVAITPTPAELAFTPNYNTIRIRGKFALETEYTVAVKPGLPAYEPMTLTQPWQEKVSFAPLEPRLYLPAFSEDQLSAGRRQFELLSVNLQKFRLRAKVFEAATAVHALRGYHSYSSRDEEDAENYYHRLDYNLVPGRTVCDRWYPAKAGVDEVKRHSLNWDDILGGKAYGVVFVETEGIQEGAPDKQPISGAQALVQVTDLGMVWKTSGDQVWVLVFSYATGQPVPGATVRLLTDENGTLAEARTDAQGLALVAASGPAWLMASKGEDLHLLNLRKSYDLEISTYRFDLPHVWQYDAENQCRALFFSDRSAYRPGETLHLKAIIRRWAGQAWEMPANSPAALSVTDARGQVVLQTNLVIASLGSLNYSMALPVSPLGQYEARLFWPATNTAEMGSSLIGSCSFVVQEFEPNAFEVRLKAPPVFGPDDPVRFQLSAGYYLGKPLTRAKVKWTFDLSQGNFMPKGFEDFRFGPENNAWHWRNGRDLNWKFTGELALDGQEQVELAPTLPVLSNAPVALEGTMLVEVTDLNQQTITEECPFLQHRANFYLGMRERNQVLKAGEAVPVEVAAVLRDGTPCAAPVPIQARLAKLSWQTVAKQGAGQALVYETEELRTAIGELDTQTRPLVREGTRWNFARSSAPAPSLPVAEPGEYLLEITGQDDAGRRLKTEYRFSVVGLGEVAWKYRNPVQIDLVPDKESYLPGETATVLVKTPFGGPALVTVERETVRRSMVVELAGNAPAVRLPLEEQDAPNIYVSVMMLRGIEHSPKALKMPEMRIGYCALNIAQPQAHLTPAISVSQPFYEPRKEVQVEVEVRDGRRALAPDTEVTLYAVDEGILSLTAYETPDPQAFFVRPRPLTVTTWFSLPNLLPEDPAEATFANKGYLIGGGGEAERELRKNFLPCAFWNATLRTDASGKVRAAFTAPDSLTRYRVIAVAHNARQQFGSSAAHFEVRKPLMVTPALPLFASLGDRLEARAVVHNMTEADGEVEITLRTDARASAERAAATVKVPAHGSVPVTFAVTMRGTGASEWIWQGRFLDPRQPFQDTVKSTLPIDDPRPLLREVLARRVTGDTNLLAGANPRLMEGQGRVIVRLANTRLAEVGEAAGYLLHYPYGCMEQTCSSLLPWLALNQLPAGQAILARSQLDRRRALATGLDRLLSMQTTSGGLAYWPEGAAPMRWASGYGGMTLALLQRNGVEVPEEALKKLAAYLSQELRGAGDERQQGGFSDSCLCLLALAMLGHPEPAYQARLFEKRARLSAEDRAVLALAILEARGDKAMARELLEGKGAATEPDWFACSSRLLAMQLMAWCRCQPDHPKTEELVETLLGGQQNGHWITTQGNSWGLLALVDYARLVEGQCEAASGELRYGAQTQAFALPKDAGVCEFSFPLTADALPISLAAGRRVFARAVIEARPPSAPAVPEDHGFSLQREFYRLDDDGRCQALTQPQPGDRVLVRLRLIVPRAAHYVAVESPLPALLEPIHAEFVTQKTAAAGGAPDWWNDYRETRRDRALFFRDHLSPGTYTIEHLARVRARGTATAPSAKVEEMYHPARLGLSGAVRLGEK